MAGFPWLPIGTALPGGATSGRLLEEGPGWQLCATGQGGPVALLLDPVAGPAPWAEEVAALGAAEVANGIACLVFPASARPSTLAGLALRTPPLDKAEALALARALLAMAARRPGAGWASALVLLPRRPEEPGHALATAAAAPGENRRAALLAALSGGFGTDPAGPADLQRLNPRLDLHTAQTVLDLLADTAVPAAGAPDAFALPGQPALEALLREQVLDVLHRPDAYARLGVGWPGGVLLAGPPGCGKSFAAARLAEFLGWTLHEISVADVGSAWLHETPRQIRAVFARAAAAAPAIVLLEELDALGQAREGGGGASGARAEELNTLLREVEAARKRRLLVVGTTNRPEAIDRALLRRGRFDLLATMDYPDAEGAAAMLAAQLSRRPHAAGMDMAGAGRRLARRPASDLAWVVDEAARLAVRSGRTEIDDLLLARAVSALPGRG